MFNLEVHIKALETSVDLNHTHGRQVEPLQEVQHSSE
jgi:hypothetical protein